ncbi:MAG: hypothetical protein WC752_04135 [Patescibacteria group bacterium]|jgi:hypothetical protein
MRTYARFLAYILFNNAKASEGLSIEGFEVVPQDLVPEMWSEYSEFFGKSRGHCPHDQMNYEEDTFAAACCDQDLIKFVFYVHGLPAGFAVVAKPGYMGKAPWVSPTFFPNDTVYLTVLMIYKKYRGLDYFVHFIDHVIKEVTTRWPRHGCAFDIPNKKKMIAYLIMWRIRRANIRARQVGSQDYYVGRPIG